MHRILVIDDDDAVRDALGSFLSEKGFEVFTAADGYEGIELLKQEKLDIFLVDLIMPKMGGIDLLKKIAELHIETPSIVITAHGTIRTAVEAMKVGAFDYITKPFVLDELLLLIDKAIQVSRLQRENIMLRKQLKRKYNFDSLIGDSAKMQSVYEMIEKVADTDSTILITGKSGTGKELIAKTIHYNSSRSHKPFVPLNCAAIPRDLLESELFGHEKGAFTGATISRSGRFELANEGTLFLDEIGELDPSLQVKLLRVLQEREFERVGGVKTVKVDVRILSATNRDLEKATKEGKFREDLFYRLNVIPIHMPALTERLDDIPLLVDNFSNKFAKKRKRAPLIFPRHVLQCFGKYQWPGNVRELENLIERLTILVSGDAVAVNDLPEKFFDGLDLELPPEQITVAACSGDNSDFDIPDSGINLVSVIDAMERKLILKSLEKTKGVKNRAAELLGLNRTTLIEKLKKKNIEFQKR